MMLSRRETNYVDGSFLDGHDYLNNFGMNKVNGSSWDKYHIYVCTYLNEFHVSSRYMTIQISYNFKNIYTWTKSKNNSIHQNRQFEHLVIGEGRVTANPIIHGF